jgi:hypothetical protein
MDGFLCLVAHRPERCVTAAVVDKAGVFTAGLVSQCLDEWRRRRVRHVHDVQGILTREPSKRKRYM